ncbi:hypothetical protein GQ54DRAFT_200744 [Martensiomyces pterosporus]|nr:hypothetical protein GQ54DRAFT_200744 [Martensiomyces pterosporus]
MCACVCRAAEKRRVRLNRQNPGPGFMLSPQGKKRLGIGKPAKRARRGQQQQKAGEGLLPPPLPRPGLVPEQPCIMERYSAKMALAIAPMRFWRWRRAAAARASFPTHICQAVAMCREHADGAQAASSHHLHSDRSATRVKGKGKRLCPLTGTEKITGMVWRLEPVLHMLGERREISATAAGGIVGSGADGHCIVQSGAAQKCPVGLPLWRAQSRVAGKHSIEDNTRQALRAKRMLFFCLPLQSPAGTNAPSTRGRRS